MAERYLDISTTSGRLVRKEAIVTSQGAADAGKIVALGPDGKIDPSLVSAGAESGEAMTTTEALTEGDWVTIYDVSGQRRCRKALASDDTRPARGYVTATTAANATATVFTRGVNRRVSLTSSGLVAADRNKLAFLSAATSGGTTKVPPSGNLNLLQVVGSVLDVNANYAEVDFHPGIEVIM